MFLTEQPGLELALDLDAHANVREGAHYGVVVEEAAAVDATIARLQAAGYPVDIETEETCCYTVQNKVWATDPDGRRRETYYVFAESEERDNEVTTCCKTESTATAASPACTSFRG